MQPNEHQPVETAENKSPPGFAPQYIDLLSEGQESASSRFLERNNLVSGVHSSMRTSTIGHEHHPIHPHSPTGQGFRQGQAGDARGLNG